MGYLLGSIPFVGLRGFALIAALAVLCSGWTAVRPAEAEPVVATLVAAGDIAGCGQAGDTATANLVASIDGTVATLGDNAYNDGTAAQFADCYGPTWGRFKERTRPTAGNHEYRTPGAAGYFDYFGDRAGPTGTGWYSYDLGGWHVIALNSNCVNVGCGNGSEQERWLRADLAANQDKCTLAYWHEARFSSDNRHGNSAAVVPFWEALYEYGADVVLSAHAHDYERFAPQTPWGAADPVFGIRQFVVGTGGNGHYGFGGVKPNSEVRNADTYGVLRLSLRPAGYDWLFVPEAGKTFSDAGSSTCHGRRPPTSVTSSTTAGPAATTTTAGQLVTTTSATRRSTTTARKRRPRWDRDGYYG